jgi:hypothetical protein
MSLKHTCFIVGLFIFASVLSTPVYAGDLEPSGPPTAGTMKPLDQVEPRTPIPASAAPADPFTISESGSYYLTGNRLCSGIGLLVEADNVTIDLCGFTLAGPDAGATLGISMNGRDNVEIRNGTVRDFAYGIYEMSSYGKNQRIVDVRVLSNSKGGILMYGRKSRIQNCLVADNAETVSGSSSMIYVGNGSTVTGNTVCNNGKQSSDAFYCIYAGFGCTVTGNSVYENGPEKSGSYMYGIQVHGGSILSNNTVYLNAQSVADTIFYAIYAGPGCTVTGNTAVSNGLSAVDSTVYGFYIADCCVVDCNTAYQNNGTNQVHASCSLGVNSGL